MHIGSAAMNTSKATQHVLVDAAPALAADASVSIALLEAVAADRSLLELKEAKLLSSDRLERLALKQRFIDPDPEKIVFLPGKEGTVAQTIDPAQSIAAGGASN